MAIIKTKVISLNEEFEQYTSIGAYIQFKNSNIHLLEAITLDTEEDEGDLNLLEAFLTHWEMTAEEEKMEFSVDVELEKLVTRLQSIVDNE